MIVTKNEDNSIEFNNGLKVYGDHSQDCCEYNYLDFEQLLVGTTLPDMKAKEFYSAITLKEDGFVVKDVDGVPKWVQARSSQNGYYSYSVDVVIEDETDKIIPKRSGQDWGELFSGDIKE